MRLHARSIAGAYFLFAAAWIVLSDLALLGFAGELPDFLGGSLVKGGIFVIVTTAGLYWLVSRRLGADPAVVAANETAERAGRRRAEARLSDAEERYRALFERSLDCVFVADFEGNFLDANHAALDLLGYRRDEIPSIRFQTVLAEEDLPRAFDSVKELGRTGNQPEAKEYRLRRKDGAEVIVEVRTTPVYDEGKPAAVLGTARDITGRKRAQRDLELKNVVLSTLQEASPDAILLVDESSRIVTYNQRFLELWRIPEALARAGDDGPVLSSVVSQMHNPDEFINKIRYLYSHREEKSRDELHTKDNRIIERHSAPVIGAGGEYFGRVWYFRDVTERRRAESELRESEARFRTIVEQSISGFYLIRDRKFAYVNARFAKIFGYPGAEEIVGRDPVELVAPKDRATVAENIRRRIAGETKSLSYSFSGLRKDGTEVDVGVHGSLTMYEGRPAIIGLLQDISERKRAEEEIKRYVARLEQAMQSTINVVATIGELRDPYTHGHERRVGEIAAAIGEEMGLPASQVEGIRIAGYLHDVGKIGVPAEILSKPGKLTKAEYDLVKDHARQSYEILKTVPFPWPVAEAAWQHHERLDGSGYPGGLKGEDILLEARVLAVADTLEAMSSHRPYRPGLGVGKALEEIEKNRGRLYDPRAVDACLRLFRDKGYKLPD